MKKLLELGVKKVKVIKFGGSSLASAVQLEKVLQIVKEDSSRKFVVVSAPGKRSSEDIKVTDLLISYYQAYINNQATTAIIEKIIQRYEDILDELALDKAVLTDIAQAIQHLSTLSNKNNPHLLDAFLASGEDNNAKLVAAFFKQRGLQARYINPLELGLIVSDEPGNARILPSAAAKIGQFKETEEILVIPGFFGYTEAGDICTFSRGGSDITGSIVAAGVHAEMYENFTDVNGIFVAHPGIIHNPKTIKEITYREMRELAYAGFAVLHDEALMPAYRANIPVVIKNTNNPEHPGTIITTSRMVKHDPVVGIASDQGFASIYISKYLMNRELGFGRRLLQILEELGLSYEHMPSGIDDISIILREQQLSAEIEEKLMHRLEAELEPDELRITHGLSMLMVVGEGMRQRIGVMADSAVALAENKINLEMINQGSSEVSIMFGIKENQEEKAIQALYETFFDA
jgi:aspartate kinase